MKRSRLVPPFRLLALGLVLAALPACEGLPRHEPATSYRAGSVSLPLAVSHAPRVGAIDALHYALDLTVDPDTRRIEGTCTVRLQPARGEIDRVDLDLEGLETYGVLDERGRSLAFTHEDGVLSIALPEPLAPGRSIDLIVRYGGHPQKGLWFVGDGNGDPTHVFTQGECEDARWWFPCWDTPSDRASSEVTVTMPSRWTSVAAGERLSREESNGTATEHWRMDTEHPTYLVSLVAGDLAVHQAEWEGVPLLYLSPPEYAQWLDEGFAETAEVLSFLSDVTGLKYPYPKYSQACVEDFPFGGMENISATTMTTKMLWDERGRRDYNPAGLIAHEAAHQWFGDLMTCRDWSHIWLNESFATYMANLYFERTRGVDEFRVRMRDTQREYREGDVGDDRRPMVWNVYKDPIDLFFGGQTYPGGASRLHLLRFVLGDEDFFEGIRDYVADNAGRSVVTEDVQRAMEQASGRDLSSFFQQWFHSPGFPELVVKWEWDEPTQTVLLNVEQVQGAEGGTPRVFRMPVEVEIRDSRGTTVQRLEIDERRERFRLAAADRPVWVRFDKHGWLPAAVESKKSGSEWLAILAGDDDVNGRRDAAAALGDLAHGMTDFERKELYVAELVDRLRKDRGPAVRTAAARALGVAGGLEARARLMTAAAEDPEAKVRVAALEALKGWGADRDVATLAQQEFTAGYSWDTMGAAAGLYCSAAPERAFPWLSQQLVVESPHDELRSELIEHLGGLSDPGVVDLLVGWAQDPAAGSATRQAAAKQLGKHPLAGSRASRTLAALLDEDDFRLRVAALEALSERDDPISRRAVEAYYGKSVFPREKRTMEAALRRYSVN